MSKSSAEESYSVLSGTWLISFADLITLLLCTFLMFFSMTYHSGKWSNNAKVNPSSGTGIANQPIQRLSELSIWLTTHDLTNEESRFSEAGLEKVKKLLETVRYRTGPIEITVCDNKASDEQLVGRLTLLGRQLVDIGVAEESIAYRLLGGRCSVLGQDALGKIEVTAR